MIFMLILLGILLIIFLLWLIKSSLGHDKIFFAGVCIGICMSLHIFILCLCFFDAGYSWVDASPFDIAFTGYPEILFPYVLSPVIISLVLIRRHWTALILNVFQIITIIPVLLWIELKTSLSFLNITIILFFYLSILGSFFMIPSALRLFPKPGSHWDRVIFGGRCMLIEGLKELANEKAWLYMPPDTILESGSLKGEIGGFPLIIDSLPQLVPPYYRVNFRIFDGAVGHGILNELTVDPARKKCFHLHNEQNSSILSYLSTYHIPLDRACLEKILCLISKYLKPKYVIS
jgi:hypothetical protein